MHSISYNIKVIPLQIKSKCEIIIKMLNLREYLKTLQRKESFNMILNPRGKIDAINKVQRKI